MILNNLGTILSKIKETKQLYKMFIKPFQQQLHFIESIIENDAQQIKNQSKWCYCIIKRFAFSNKTFTKFQLFNAIFYKVFTLMTQQQKQEYFLQLLTYIEQVHNFYSRYIEKGKHERVNLNKYKKKLQSKLIDKIINKKIMSILEKEQEQMRSFELLTNLKGVVHRKIGRFVNYKLVLIEKVLGEQTKIIMDLRNYLILDYCKERKSLSFYAIYETLHPLSIHLQFLQQGSNEAGILFEKYYQIFQEMMRIGKIQKLVQNIDLSKLYKYNQSQIVEHNFMMQTFLKNESQQQESDKQEAFLTSQDIMKSTIKGKLKHLQRQQTIKAFNRYQMVKKNLIATLNILAEKKQNENKKIQDFLKRETISKPKTKSTAVIKALNSTESFVPRPLQINNQVKDELKDIALHFINMHEEKPQQSHLSIINYGVFSKQKANQKHDSFYTECHRQEQTNFFQLFKRKGENEPKRQYRKNVYVKFYGEDYEFAYIQSLTDMIRMEFTEKNYAIPQAKILHESKSLKGDKFAKFKASWFQKIVKIVRLYCRKQSPTFIKIFIKVDIELKSLVLALLNIQAYPFWHPNIKKIEIKEAITSQNTIHYRMQMLNPITNKIQVDELLLHLFKFEDKYYIIQKILTNNDQERLKSKGLLGFLNFMKSHISYSKITFLMIRIANITKNGFSEMIISFDHSPQEQKHKDLAQKEALSFFINFIFIKDYWKLKREEKNFGQSIVTLDWQISKNSFSNISQILVKQKDEQIPDNFQELKMQKQLSIIKKATVQSSSQLIHSQQFFDM